MKKYNLSASAKSIRFMAATAFLGLSAIFFSCGDDDNSTSPYVPTAASFNTLRQSALESRTQHFSFDADGTMRTLTSAKGVTININTGCLTLNGVAVTGNVDLDFVELFKGGEMAVTNKTTRGVNADGDLAMLVSGGEFFVSIYKNGQKLETNCGVSLVVPGNLSNGVDEEMSLWTAVDTDTIANQDIVWNEVVDGGANVEGGMEFGDDSYFMNFGAFGWTNVDKFYSFAGPKTTILVDVPELYDNVNSAVYLSYDGEGNSLANLDTYTTDGYFSEHYGQIPVGLACHVIFVTEENGNYRYAIKAVTIVADGITTFTLSETTTGTEAELVSAINAVQD